MLSRHSILVFGVLGALAFACAFAPRAAQAETDSSDGLYGRMDGDIGIELEAGPELDRRGAWGLALARVLYLDTAGAYLAYADGFDSDRAVARMLSAGISIRPLFLPRWGTDLETGPALSDLTLDSLTFDLGALFPFTSSSHAASGSASAATAPRGPGFEIGASLAIPLSGRANGLWLGVRGSVQYAAWELARSDDPRAKLGAAAALTLGFHEILLAHWIDAGDRRTP